MHLLWTPGTPHQGASSYAMGFVPGSIDGHRELWHNGLTPTIGGYTLNAIFPDDDLAVAILSNGAAFAGESEALVKGLCAMFFQGNLIPPGKNYSPNE